jgi:hypothetical protein
MEPYIIYGIEAWFSSRWKMDFLDDKKQPRETIKGLKRWVAHILLTTTVNIQTAQLSSEQKWLLPPNHFINFELKGQGDPSNLWVSIFK